MRLRARGQALVETALVSVLLALLLAGAVDFGRAYFTDVVVTNMAAEGAAYASLNPDYDKNYQNQPLGSCSNLPIADYKNIQDRLRLVASEHGLVIKQQDRDSVVTTITTPGTPNPGDCVTRCFGGIIRVQVTYTIHDLFLPRLLGINNITITEAATQQLQRSSYAAEQAGTCSP